MATVHILPGWFYQRSHLKPEYSILETLSLLLCSFLKIFVCRCESLSLLVCNVSSSDIHIQVFLSPRNFYVTQCSVSVE